MEACAQHMASLYAEGPCTSSTQAITRHPVRLKTMQVILQLSLTSSIYDWSLARRAVQAAVNTPATASALRDHKRIKGTRTSSLRTAAATRVCTRDSNTGGEAFHGHVTRAVPSLPNPPGAYCLFHSTHLLKPPFKSFYIIQILVTARPGMTCVQPSESASYCGQLSRHKERNNTRRAEG